MKLGEDKFDEIVERCRDILGYERAVKNSVFTAHIEPNPVGVSPESAELRYEPGLDWVRFIHHYPDKENVEETFISIPKLYEFLEETNF